MAASAREFLGKRRAFGEVQRAYLRGAALEVDTYDWYDLRRRRIQLDEVQRITLHRELRRGNLVAFLVFGLIFGGLAAVMIANDAPAVSAWVLFAIFAAVGLLGALWTLVFRSSVVTVTSPRAKVVIVHVGRSRHSRELFRLLADRTRETQAVSSAPGEAPRAG